MADTDSKAFKYISKRIALIATVLFVFNLLLFFYDLILCIRGDGSWEIALLLLVEIVLAGVVFSVWIHLPYKRYEKTIKRFIDGYIDTDEDIRSLQLTPNTAATLEMVKKLLDSTDAMDLNKRQAQYLALQNQINPHFLYNTLDSIRGEAIIAGQDSVADMTASLAKFFRYTITRVENLVTVEDELENCKTYFKIQKYRFGDRLNLKIEIPEEEEMAILCCKIPKLTLQPILENSIIHGTELKVGQSNITLSFERTDDRLLIAISDDGVGMDGKKLIELNKRLSMHWENLKKDSEGGIALSNVNNRIQLLFGDKYGMHVYSIEGQGTDVTISLPFSD